MRGVLRGARSAAPWAALGLASAFALAACGGGGDPEKPPPEPLPNASMGPTALPQSMEALLIENQSGCHENEECESGLCRFGTCLALVRLDAPWQVAGVMERVKAQIAEHPDGPELRRRVVATLDRLVDEGAALAFRARAIQGLEALGEAADLSQRFDALPMPLQELAAVALARLGDTNPKALALVVALTESDADPVAIEAVRALGHAKGFSEALPTLLSLLAPDVSIELQRAAIDGLRTLGDARAIGPLAAWLRQGVEPLGDRIAMALRDLAHPDQPLPPDPDRWDAWLAKHPPPPAPPYTPRATKTTPDGLDLPEP
ncbi:MAG: HEAT repeat domain-containing protein [Myxococcota bacterium]